MEKLAPLKFFTDSHYNYSNYQHKSKQQGINTPQWETQAIDFFDLKYYKFNLNVTIDHSHVPAVLPLLSLTDFSSKCSLSPFSQSPAPCPPPPPPFYSFNPCSYHYNCLDACQSFKDIFLNFIGFPPTLILKL